jgi:hypothetical protein
MTEAVSNCLTERHLMLFGAIIRWFARYELLMQEIMACVAESDCSVVTLLTHGLNFSEKRQTLLNLLRHRMIPLDRFDQVNNYLMIPHTLTRLRNEIAHAEWVAGTGPNSIQPDWILRPQPSVKPLYDGIEAPDKKDVECEEDKVVYTLEDLNEIVETLTANYAGFSDYLREKRLINVRT